MDKIFYLIGPYIASFLCFSYYLKIRNKTEISYRYWSPLYFFGSICCLIIAIGITFFELKIIK